MHSKVIRLHVYMCILFQILSPFRLLQNIEQSSLCYTVDPCWLSILNKALCLLFLLLAVVLFSGALPFSEFHTCGYSPFLYTKGLEFSNYRTMVEQIPPRCSKSQVPSGMPLANESAPVWWAGSRIPCALGHRALCLGSWFVVPIRQVPWSSLSKHTSEGACDQVHW